MNKNILILIYIFLFISIMLSSYSFYNTNHQIKELQNTVTNLTSTIKIMRENDVRGKMIVLEENVNNLKTQQNNIKGDITGTLNNTKIKENIITTKHIKDKTINSNDVDETQIQLRIKGNCSEDYAIKTVLEDGSVECINIIPTLKQVLEKNNNAERKNIQNIKNLDAEKISTKELCINNTCKTEWSNVSIKFSTFTMIDNDIDGNQKTLHITPNQDFCALAIEHSDRGSCEVYYYDGEWYLRALDQACKAICFVLKK